MRIYEELFIVDPNATDEQTDAVVAQIEEVVKAAGGSIDKVDKWGIRKLAYRVKKQTEGFYVLVQFSATGIAVVREIERKLRVDEVVLKYLTVRIDEKLKWLEKRKKVREKRAARKPPPTRAEPKAAPKEPAAAVPGTPGAPKGPESPTAPGLPKLRPSRKEKTNYGGIQRRTSHERIAAPDRR